MAFNWEDYLDLAKDLAKRANQSNKTEALLRSAISRSYCAAFLLSRNYLRDKLKDNNIPSGSDVHSYIRDAFANNGNPILNSIARNLNQLRTQHNLADYNDTYFDLRIKAPLAVLLAEAIINDLAKL
jgi:L-rhamnose isomerase